MWLSFRIGVRKIGLRARGSKHEYAYIAVTVVVNQPLGNEVTKNLLEYVVGSVERLHAVCQRP